MRYISTRSLRRTSVNFCDTLLRGLAPDGGLYLPEEYPQVTGREMTEWRQLPYHELAFRVCRKFIGNDILLGHLAAMCRRTYTADVYRYCRPGRDAHDITPLTTLESDFHLLELSNGPTLAFKDMAMQLLGNLFEYQLEQIGESLNILGGTSGDTGSSAEYAMRDRRGMRVFMLSPKNGMSPFQAAQMYSLTDPTIFNIAIEGVFDDCQDIVKAVSNDAAFKKQFKIGTVNSINWARVMAQVVYYFKGYFAATKSNDEVVSFAVPTGNFGNICAGHIARMMGLPIAKLVLGTNENDVLDDFFRTGVYRPRKSSETVETSSPSMDISRASNFERFVFDMVGRRPHTILGLWGQIEAHGQFDMSGMPEWKDMSRSGIVSGSSTHADRVMTIREVWETYDIVIDPHTADAMKVGQQYREKGIPMIVLETAQPAKFGRTIFEALGGVSSRPAELKGLEDLPQRVTTMAPDVEAVKRFIADRIDA